MTSPNPARDEAVLDGIQISGRTLYKLDERGVNIWSAFFQPNSGYSEIEADKAAQAVFAYLSVSPAPARGGVDAVAKLLDDYVDARFDYASAMRDELKHGVPSLAEIAEKRAAVRVSLSPAATSGSVRCTYCGDTGTVTDRVDGEITCPECRYSKPTSGAEAGGETVPLEKYRTAVLSRERTILEMHDKSEAVIAGLNKQLTEQFELTTKLAARLDAALAKPASSPAGGYVREASLSRSDVCRLWQYAVIERPSMTVEGFTNLLLAEIDDRAEALSPSTSAAEPVACGPFGHHPDPSTDFCVEVETLEGWAEDVKAGTRSQWPFWGRLSALLRFVRSDEFAELDETAQRAKATVFELEGRVTGAPPAPAAVDGQRVKALVWTTFCEGFVHQTQGGFYRIEDNGTNWTDERYWLFAAVGLVECHRDKFDTLEKAKAAAQEHHEARIRACLATDKEGA